MNDNDTTGTRRLSRLHVQKQLPELGIIVNIFGDTAKDVFDLYLEAVSLFTAPRPPSGAKREVANAAQLAEQIKLKKETVPTCPYCRHHGQVELVQWTTATGEKRKAFKCQTCRKWIK